MKKRLTGRTKNLIVLSVGLVLYIAMIITNALANILPINGKNTGELSDLYPNLFVPAGVTFSIWGVIYLLLLFYLVFQLFMAIKGNNDSIVSPIGNMIFGLTCIFNILWILTWHYLFIFTSVLVMLGYLIALIVLFLKIDKMKLRDPISKFALKLPISVNLGWISVATIANITALLVSWEWEGFGIPENIWTIIVMGVGTILAVLMLIRHRNIAYSLVIVWAYIGIIMKRSSQEIVYTDIIFTAYLSIIVIIVMICLEIFKRIKIRL